MGRGLIMAFIKIIFSIFALVGIINSKFAWKMSEGWKYKDVEPSEIYLIMSRVMAIITLLVIWFAFPN